MGGSIKSTTLGNCRYSPAPLCLTSAHSCTHLTTSLSPRRSRRRDEGGRMRLVRYNLSLNTTRTLYSTNGLTHRYPSPTHYTHDSVPVEVRVVRCRRTIYITSKKKARQRRVDTGLFASKIHEMTGQQALARNRVNESKSAAKAPVAAPRRRTKAKKRNPRRRRRPRPVCPCPRPA